MFGPPGVTQAWNPTLDITPSGRIAMSYMASTNAPGAPFQDRPEDHDRYRNTTYNGYITISDDPASSAPTFYTASDNDPSRPSLIVIPRDSSMPAQPCSQALCVQVNDS